MKIIHKGKYNQKRKNPILTQMLELLGNEFKIVIMFLI